MAGGLALPPAQPPTDEEMAEFLKNNPTMEFSADPTLDSNFDAESEATFGPGGPSLDDLFGPVPEKMAPPMHTPMPMHTPATPYSMDMPNYDARIGWYHTASAPTFLPTGPSAPGTVPMANFDPRIGWHYPAPAPMTVPTGPAMPFAMPQEGYTPASSIAPPTSAIPSRAGTPTPMGHPFRRRKPKYGPAAYLESQLKKAAPGDLTHPRTLSASEAQYTSKAKQRDDKANGLTGPRGYRKRKRMSLVQECVCNPNNAEKIKRPRNVFMLYRAAMQKKISAKFDKNDQKATSTEIGKMWQKETPEVKARFQRMYEQEKANHAAMYPEYKYQPGAKKMSRFGSESCQCGAYQANMAHAMKVKRFGGVVDTETEADESELSELDEYVPPRRSQRQSPPQYQQQAPVAPMMPQYIPDPSTFGFATPAQRAEAEAYVNDLKRKRDAAPMQPELEEPPLSKRLRSNNPPVSYADPIDDDIEDDIFGTPGKSKKRPAPISTSTGINPADLTRTPSPTLPVLGDSPARNTRSKSRASLSLSPEPNMPDYGNFDFNNFDFDQDFDFEKMMAEGVNFGSPEDGDNIVVASGSTRKSPRRSSPTSKSRPGSRGSLSSKKSTSPTGSYQTRSQTSDSRQSARGSSK